MNKTGKRIVAITLSVFASASCLVTPTFASTAKDKGMGDLKRKSFAVEQKTDTPPLAESKASIKSATLSAKKVSGYTVKITRKSKQKATIKITTKDPKIYKYKVNFCENGEKYSRGLFTIKPSKKHVNTVSSNRLFAPSSSCYVLVYSYRKNKKKTKAAYKFKMDGKLGTKLYTVTGAKNATVDACNAHKSSLTVVTTKSLSANDIETAMKNNKWYNYNLYNRKNLTYITNKSGFTYKKKRYKTTTLKYEYELTASQDSALRKKYTSISKAATGSTKSKASYKPANNI